VTLAAMVGLGVLLGKYVLSYCASSLQAPRSSQAPTTGSGLLDSSDSQPSPISPKSTEERDPRPSGQPAAVTLDTTDITPGTREVAEESVLYRVQLENSMKEVKQRNSGVNWKKQDILCMSHL